MVALGARRDWGRRWPSGGMRINARSVGAGLLAAAVLPCAAGADPLDVPWHNPLRDRAFLFSGGDLTGGSAFVWSGFVASPFGRLDEDGARLRLMSGYGRYRYRGATGANEGAAVSGELMLGRRHAFEAVHVTAYLGAHFEEHRLRNPDPGNPVQGARTGVKAAVETFARLTPDWIATASASFSSVYRKYHARVSVARELDAGFSAGIEGALLGDARYTEPRAGLQVSKALQRHLLTLAGGLLHNSARGSGAYVTLSLYSPY